jgi:hypothetical protein
MVLFSGLIMNKDKTEGLWIGKLKHCKDKVGGIKWTDKPVKTLGIYFGHDKEECLLFQINLKHLLSISFLYFSGTTQALATYVNIGTIKHLIIKIFPKIVYSKLLYVS